MLKSARQSGPELSPLKILVTGFYDWEDANRQPAGDSNTTHVNPSGRLLEGNHLQPLLTKLQTHKSGRSIEWDFKILRVTRHEAKSAGFENYDIVISLGLSEGLPSDHLQLEVDAINKFQSLDVDELTRVVKLPQFAESHINTSLRHLANIQTTLDQALTRVRTQASTLSFHTRRSDSTRELSEHLLKLSEVVGSAKLRAVFALPAVSSFRAQRSSEKAETAEASCAKAGEELSGGLSDYYTSRLAAASKLQTKNLFKQNERNSLRATQSSHEEFFQKTVDQAERTLSDVVSLIRSAETNCYIGKTLIQIKSSYTSSRPVTDKSAPSNILKSKPAPLKRSKKYGAYELLKHVNDVATANTYVCNATHYHALELVNNRASLNIPLSEAYFIHMPPAALCVKWRGAQSTNAKYSKRVGMMKTEDEGMALLAEAVAELIKDLIQ